MVLLGACGASLDNSPVGSALAPADKAGVSESAPAETAAVAAAGNAQSGAGQAAAALTASSVPGNQAYKIGPLDVLEVSVFKVPELSKTVQVADSGTINLPLVGEVPAVGSTAQEIERDLTKRLGAKYLQSPQVTVYVKEFNSQRVTIEGAIKKPGVLPYRGNATLLQMIAQAEGLTETSDSTVVIFRKIDGKRSGARFDVDAIREGTADDPSVKPGDVIVAGKSALKEGFSNLMKAMPVAGVFAGVL